MIDHSLFALEQAFWATEIIQLFSRCAVKQVLVYAGTDLNEQLLIKHLSGFQRYRSKLLRYRSNLLLRLRPELILHQSSSLLRKPWRFAACRAGVANLPLAEWHARVEGTISERQMLSGRHQPRRHRPLDKVNVNR